MRIGSFGAGIMAMAVGLAAMAIGNEVVPGGGGLGLNGFERPRRHKGKGQANRRGKGAVNRSKKRPNMRHVSKRVRRKHRRAA